MDKKMKVFLKKKLEIVVVGVSIIAFFSACSSSPESSGKKLAQQACDCQKEYVKTQDKIYQDFLGKFDSYGFKTRTEARQKWQERKDEAEQQLKQCLEKVQQKVREVKSEFPTNPNDMLDPKVIQKAAKNPEKFLKEFTKNQEKSRKFDEAYHSVINQCSKQKTEKDYSAIEAKILTVIPQKPSLEKLKQDLVRRRITEPVNGYYGRNWSWQINSIDELKKVDIVNEEKVGDIYVLDVHLLLQKEANQHEADLKITCVLAQNDDWTIDFIETKDIRIVKTGRYDNCISTEIKKG